MKCFGISRLLHTAYLSLLVIFIAGNFQDAFAQAERKYIREGNRLYHKEQFDESELSYRRALENNDDLPRARFNLGNALYKQERFDEALNYYRELAEEIDDPVNRSRVYHNLGNTMLMSEQVKESIEAYKEALRNNPDDPETRYNLAFAQHLLDEMEEPPRDEDNQSGDDQDNSEDEEEQEGEQQDGDDEQDKDDEQQQDGRDQENERQSPEQDQQPRPDEISPEDARRLLEAAEREDQQVREKLMEQKASEKQPRTGKNW